MPDWSPVDSATERGDQCICITELSASMLALSAVVPGASTICANLFSAHHLPEKVGTHMHMHMHMHVHMHQLSPHITCPRR